MLSPFPCTLSNHVQPTETVERMPCVQTESCHCTPTLLRPGPFQGTGELRREAGAERGRRRVPHSTRLGEWPELGLEALVHSCCGAICGAFSSGQASHSSLFHSMILYLKGLISGAKRLQCSLGCTSSPSLLEYLHPAAKGFRSYSSCPRKLLGDRFRGSKLGVQVRLGTSFFRHSARRKRDIFATFLQQKRTTLLHSKSSAFRIATMLSKMTHTINPPHASLR